MRNLKTFVFAGILGVFAMATDASACHKKKCACPTTTVACAPAPAPVVECAPVKTKKCHMPKLSHHKATAVCAAPTAYAAPAAYYAAPMASPQASPQSSMQRM